MKELINRFISIFISIPFCTSILFLIYKLFDTGHPVWGVVCSIIVMSAFFTVIEVDCEEETIDEKKE